jgi:hypothetical protein
MDRPQAVIPSNSAPNLQHQPALAGLAHQLPGLFDGLSDRFFHHDV